MSEDPAASPAADGLGTRPADAPDMYVPTAPAAPQAAPPPVSPSWDDDGLEAYASPRGPAVVFGVVAVLVVAAVAVLGFWLIGGTGGTDDAAELDDPAPAAPVVPEEQRLHADEIYDGDWDFRLGDHEEHADFVQNWDHGDCSSATLFSSDADALIEAGCQYRIEGAYKSRDGHTYIGEQVLVFPTEAAAAEAATLLDWDGYAFQPESQSPDALLTGGAIDANKAYLIVTVATIDTEDEGVVADAQELLHYFHADHVAVFYFR